MAISVHAWWSAIVRTRGALIVALAILSLMLSNASLAATGQKPAIAVSIKPLHSLVAAVTRGVTAPELLLDGYASPHTTPLKPSTMKRLHNTDVLVWVGAGVEVFLARVVPDLNSQIKVVTLGQIDGIERLPFRLDGHDHAHTADHSTTNVDNHYWLDPQNAMRLVAHLAEFLADYDPANAALYQANAAEIQLRLRDTDRQLAELLGGLADIPYLVFHDSFQYLEHRYGLHRAVVIAEQPEVSPGARRLRQILKRVESENVKCLFTEPQFPARVVSMLQRDSSVNLATIDPLASSYAPGPDLYPQWILELGQTVHDCLTREAG